MILSPWLRASLGAASLAILAGCRDSPTAPLEPGGKYSLATINGTEVPFVCWIDGDYRHEFTSGFVILRTDGKFIAHQTVTDHIRGENGTIVQAYEDSTSGTWAKSDDRITFTDSFDGSRVTANWGGSTLVFLRADCGRLLTIVCARSTG